ncbi:DUF4350 domain-containing protein [Opitutia bacterium ISCC 51]|nr:DUF4350 domain-containing protein [Opitutae bacterium ISCC 51]QXD30181.1 DUF4350 domain-containing protein [Opitutae bacterium ISCC 52]
MKLSKIVWLSFAGLMMVNIVFAQQVPYLDYNPPIGNPAYQKGEGPRVGIDEAHTNFHTATGRYAAFANLVMRDGYRVARIGKAFSTKQLSVLDILVIANPIHESNDRNWKLPTPSAYTNKEIEAVKEWVEQGGSLFLILDHMPFPGGGGKLAEAFGFKFSNGFAYLGHSLGREPDEFKPGSGLMDCVITKGRNETERITKMVTFTGSAFQPPEEATQVLVFPDKSVSKEPKQAWRFVKGTKEIDISGWCQGAIMKVGEGRIAVFGEAASFTAQLAGPQKRPMGMAALHADQNYKLLLNVMHWLSDLEGL